MGKIYVGLLYTDKIIETSYQARENGIAIGHVLATVTYLPETAYTYYFGSAWDRNPETSFQNLTDWEAYLSKKSIEAKNPLKIKIK